MATPSRDWFLANDEDLHTDRADPTEILTVI
jgi:hypothetical protein